MAAREGFNRAFSRVAGRAAIYYGRIRSGDPEGANAKIVVRPVSGYLFDHEDFADLVGALMAETGLMADQVDVRLGYFYGDAWPPDWTWVTFILEEGGRTAVDAAVAGIIVWGRRWLRKKRATDPDARPIKARIFGPDRKVLREVEVTEVDEARD